MKKSLVLVMALVLVVAFAFADEVGTASLGLNKGVVTAGEPLTVSYTLSVENVAEDVTTIEVMGDEVADNVFVMLIKDLPNEDATYEAQKVVDADAQKTTYYIKAKELVGTQGKIYAELRDWNGVVVASAEKEFAWKGTLWTDYLELVPAAEGLYEVIAYIEFADGTRMELKGWGGHAQLIALDKYMKETVPGLEAYVSNNGGYSAAEFGAYNYLSVSAGMEFMYAKGNADLEIEDSPYLGVYGDGFQKKPSLYWSYNKGTKPAFADVELRFAGDGDPHTGSTTAYIKFKVMGENFQEGDCCGVTENDMKWGLWFAIGTGEYHYGVGYWDQEFGYHVLYTYINPSYSWEIIKGEPCKGWIKGIFYLDPSDIEIWVYAVLGTHASGIVADQPIDISGEATDEAPADYYEQNLLTNAELNLMVDVIFKDVITMSFGLLDIPVTKDADSAVMGYAIGNMVLESDLGTIDLGGQLFTSNLASMTEEFFWTAHAMVSWGEMALPGLLDSLSNIRLGAIANGSNSGLSGMGLYACFYADPICCIESLKVGLDLSVGVNEQNRNEFSFNKVFATYGHEIGTYGPVDLVGEIGVVYSMDTVNAIDQGVKSDWGENAFVASEYYDWVLGVGYEVTGTMSW